MQEIKEQVEAEFAAEAALFAAMTDEDAEWLAEEMAVNAWEERNI